MYEHVYRLYANAMGVAMRRFHALVNRPRFLYEDLKYATRI